MHSNPTSNLSSRRILIVGGSSGIGLALARQVAQRGAHTIVASPSAARRADELRAAGLSGNCEFLSFDVTVEREAHRLLERCDSLDHLAVTIKAPLVRAPFLQLPLEDARRAFEVKFWGQYHLARAAHPRLRPGGSIVLSAGTLASHPHEGFSIMSAVAGAVESLCKALALELAPVRVNAVSPGFTSWQEMDSKIPLGLAKDAQVANSYLFLMNDRYITGTTVVSDGGATLV